uniref:Uncharacterized protein n=1 Tax=Lactuca sativa TaxID=4236 RepID=A0A9R1VBD7_LACSA|nr:hypothetical protein LSAT_V11C500235290 [Lactuca sativa]
MQVSAYLLGEYSHLLARRPGCSPKDIFVIIHEKLPTDSNNIHSSLNIRKDFDALSTTRSRITKLDLGNIQQLHFFLYMQNLIIFNFTHIDRYETCIDTEIQQRAVQLFIFNSTLAKILNF